MNIDDLMREGERPAISPNAGRVRDLAWTPEDWGRYGAALKAAFPDILFYEDFGHVAYREEKPEVRFFERLDDPAIARRIRAFFPYEGWKPDLVRVLHRFPYGSDPMYWTWAHYLSPLLGLNETSKRSAGHMDWRGQAVDAPIEVWHAGRLNTSYRRLLVEERRIEGKVYRLAQKQCVRAVPVDWSSLEDFRAGRFTVSKVGFMIGKGWTSQAVVDWCLEKPQRVIDLFVNVNGSAHACLPVERVPDSAWGDIRKPKWAERA